MKKILLPTDFSDNSFEAIRYALLVYKDVKCTFYLLHTFNPPVYQTEYLLGSPGQIGLGDVLQETSLLKLEQLKKRLEDQYSNTNHTFIIHTAFNTLLNEITEMTQSENIDMIVMGTTGATGAKEILFGSNTVHVIKKSKCPVIAIPPKFEYEAPIEILFPTDFEISYPKKEMEPLLLIARQHKSRINVLHVRKTIELNIVQKENKKQLDRLLVNMAIFHSVADNEIIPAVNQFQEKNKINLLVMVQNKHSFIEKLFIEPVIKKIGFHITIPFLVIPQK
tara:strand:- start:682 stop:1518 length:837 start_codon:yes stop_codon:yes gene_type:complete